MTLTTRFISHGTVFFSHNETVSAGLSAAGTISRTGRLIIYCFICSLSMWSAFSPREPRWVDIDLYSVRFDAPCFASVLFGLKFYISWHVIPNKMYLLKICFFFFSGMQNCAWLCYTDFRICKNSFWTLNFVGANKGICLNIPVNTFCIINSSSPFKLVSDFKILIINSVWHPNRAIIGG